MLDHECHGRAVYVQGPVAGVKGYNINRLDVTGPSYVRRSNSVTKFKKEVVEGAVPFGPAPSTTLAAVAKLERGGRRRDSIRPGPYRPGPGPAARARQSLSIVERGDMRTLRQTNRKKWPCGPWHIVFYVVAAVVFVIALAGFLWFISEVVRLYG